jgi:hypothetical protein
MRRTFRPYQWEAIRDLSQYLWDGERRAAFVAPTGAGKSIVTAAVLKQVSTDFTSAVIATPLVTIEESFAGIQDDVWHVASQSSPGSFSAIQPFTFKDFFFHRKTDDYWTESQREFKQHIRSIRPRFFTLVTTHSAVSRWGLDTLSDDLSKRLLVLDEAHHAGSAETEARSRVIAQFANEWHARGGAVLYITATPYRTDDLDVLPDDTKMHIWSMADHAASGYGPGDFQVLTENLETEVRTTKQYQGEDLPDKEEAEGTAYRQMVERWRKDGRPKTVFIVPSKNSRQWAARLQAALEQERNADGTPKVRVLNAVGPDAKIKVRLNQVLAAERKVRRFQDSKWDVILCCKRFDEGTDWPLCSHVYNYGIPRSFGLTVQRWGRAFRNKRKLQDEPGIEGHTHPDTAHLVFFVPKIPEDARQHFEKFHHEYTALLSCYIARWTTAQPFGREMRNRGEGPWARRPSPTEPPDGVGDFEPDIDAIRDDQTFRVTDEEQARADLLLTKFEAKFKGLNGRPPTVGETAAFIETAQAPARVLLAARLTVLERLPEEAQAKYREAILAPRRKEKKARRKITPEMITSDAELRAIFMEVVEPYRDQTNTVSDKVFAVMSSFTGESAQEIEEQLRERLLAEKPDLTEEMIVEAARNRQVRGLPLPTNASGDASLDFGKAEGTWGTWGGIEGSLIHGRRGLQGGTTLHALLVKHGLRQSLDTSKRKWGPPLTEEIIVAAIRCRIGANRGLPSSRSGDATEDFGHSETWACVAAAMRKGARGLQGGDTLRDLLARHGFIVGSPAERLTNEAVEQAVRARVRREGRPPSRASGNAFVDFGFPITWAEVDRFCLRNGSSLAMHAAKHKAKALTEESILSAVANRVARGQGLPHKASGDASDDFGFCQTWGAVDRLLRDGLKGLPGGSSLSDLLHRHGLREGKSELTEKQIVAAIARRVARGHGLPVQGSGDATEDFGHPESWMAVDEALRDGRRGLPGGSSLSDFKVRLRLKEPRRQLTEHQVLEAMLHSIQRGAGVPNSASGDATVDFGFKEHWRKVDSALRDGLRGLPGGDSLSGLAKKHGLK